MGLLCDIDKQTGNMKRIDNFEIRGLSCKHNKKSFNGDVFTNVFLTQEHVVSGTEI